VEEKKGKGIDSLFGKSKRLHGEKEGGKAGGMWARWGGEKTTFLSRFNLSADPLRGKQKKFGKLGEKSREESIFRVVQ